MLLAPVKLPQIYTRVDKIRGWPIKLKLIDKNNFAAVFYWLIEWLTRFHCADIAYLHFAMHIYSEWKWLNMKKPGYYTFQFQSQI